jgi:hypothetical protein
MVPRVETWVETLGFFSPFGAKPVVTSVIIGAKRLDQLQDNLAAIELTLTQDESFPRLSY